MTDITTHGITVQDDPNDDNHIRPDEVPIGLPSADFSEWVAQASTPSLVEALRQRLEYLSTCVREIDRSADFTDEAVLD